MSIYNEWVNRMKTNCLERLFYWNNGIEHTEYIWPQEVSNKSSLSEIDTKRICDYMRSGKIAVAWAGSSACRICGVSLGNCCMTDGKYIWPQYAEHYLDAHKISIPCEFHSHVIGKDTTTSGSVDIKYGRPNISEELWLEWCKKNRDFNQFPPSKPHSIPDVFEYSDVISYENISDLFFTIERLDIIVDKIYVPHISYLEKDERLKECIYTDSTSHRLWSSEIVVGSKAIVVCSDKYYAVSLLTFENGIPTIYCGCQPSIFVLTRIAKKYCPDIIKQFKTLLWRNE